MASAFVLQHVQAGIPVRHIYQSILCDQDIRGFCGECNIGAWVDQLLGRGRYPVGEFLWRECIPDIEYADTGNVIGREDCFLTLKSPRTVLMQVVRAERSESTEVSFLRCR